MMFFNDLLFESKVKGGMEKQKALPSTDSLTKQSHFQRCSGLTSGAGNSIWISLWVTGAQKLRYSYTASQAISRKWDEESITNWDQYSNAILSVPKCWSPSVSFPYFWSLESVIWQNFFYKSALTILGFLTLLTCRVLLLLFNCLNFLFCMSC